MFHSLPHFLTPTQTSPPERTAPPPRVPAHGAPAFCAPEAATGGREAQANLHRSYASPAYGSQS